MTAKGNLPLPEVHFDVKRVDDLNHGQVLLLFHHRSSDHGLHVLNNRNRVHIPDFRHEIELIGRILR